MLCHVVEVDRVGTLFEEIDGLDSDLRSLFDTVGKLDLVDAQLLRWFINLRCDDLVKVKREQFL